MHQKPLGGRVPPDPLGELKRSPRSLAAVNGLGPGRGRGKGEGKERRGWSKGGKGRGGEGWKGREKGWEGRKREGREEGTGRGPQFKKNDPPPVIRWLVTGLA